MNKVLVVEDSPMFQEIYNMYISKFADVIIAGTISEARNVINDSSQHFDVIILDMNLPVDTGSHIMGKATVLMPSIHMCRRGIPVFASSTDDFANQILSSLGCIETNKTTALKACREYFQNGKLD